MESGIKNVGRRGVNTLKRMDEAFLPNRVVELQKADREAEKAYKAWVRRDPKEETDKAIAEVIERIKPIMNYPDLKACLEGVLGLMNDYPNSAVWDVASMQLRRELVAVAMRLQDKETAMLREKQKDFGKEAERLFDEWQSVVDELSDYVVSDECRIEYLENKLKSL